jgi:hypothetical protein
VPKYTCTLSIRLRPNQYVASPTYEYRYISVGICLGTGRDTVENSFEPVQNTLLIALTAIAEIARLVFPTLADKVWINHY